MYDWSGAHVGHPFLDVAHLRLRLPPPFGEDTAPWLQSYLDSWRAGFPDAVLRRASDLALTADRVFQAVTYEILGRALRPPHAAPLAGLQARRLRELLAV